MNKWTMNLQLFAEEGSTPGAGSSDGAPEIKAEEENLPPIETGSPETAIADAKEVLVQLKAAEVSTLADVMNRLNETISEVKTLATSLRDSLQTAESQKSEIAATLAQIQAEQQAAKNPPPSNPQATTQAPGQAKGIKVLLRQK